MNLLDVAKKERLGLQKEIEAINVKLDAIENLISTYEKSGAHSISISLPVTSTKQRALIAIEELLGKQGQTPISEIISYLNTQGINIPRDTLGVYLSKEEKFVSDRVNGWRLKNTETVSAVSVPEIGNDVSNLL